MILRLLAAVSLGLAPLLAGCIHKRLGPGVFARPGAAPWSGAPLPVVLEIAERPIEFGRERLDPRLGPALARSLYETLAPSSLFVAVLPPPGVPTATASLPASAARAAARLRLELAIERFDIRQSYHWFGYYSPLILLTFQPIPGPGTLFAILVLLGVPLISDRIELAMVVRLVDPATGCPVLSRPIELRDQITYGLWDLKRINEGYYVRPERALGRIARRIASELVWQRWSVWRYLEMRRALEGAAR